MTIAEPIAGSEVEVVELPSFDEVVPCGAKIGCPRPAAWRAVAQCCHWQGLACVPCKHGLERAMAVPGWYCRDCGADPVVIVWTPL